MRSDRGSAAVEMVLLTPVLVMLMIFVVHAGRAGEGLNELRHAADQGARAASLVSPSGMNVVATNAVVKDLTSSGLSCVNPVVSTIYLKLGSTGSVTVNVTCRTSTAGLSLLGANTVSLQASSTEIVDRYRAGD